MGDTSIEWTDKTWNPTRGCSLISPGCTNCYAMKFAHRFSAEGKPFAGLTRLRAKGGPVWTGEVRPASDMLGLPMRWRKPARVFVNSMSDLFHESLPDHQIDKVFAMMMISCLHETRGGHTFQVLTKRADRMAAYLNDPMTRHRVATEAGRVMEDSDAWHDLVFYNVNGLTDPRIWLGVSVENQRYADERIPHLLATPAAVRFVSYEPALGAVDFKRWMWPVHDSWPVGFGSASAARAAGAVVTRHRQALVSAHARFLDWVIVGGESGPGARPFDLRWARDIIAQCREAGVAAFFKQAGRLVVDSEYRLGTNAPHDKRSIAAAKALGCEDCPPNLLVLWDRKGGDFEELRSRGAADELLVREFPEVRR